MNIFLKWVYSPKFKDEEEPKLMVDFNFINIDLLSLSESMQLIVKIIGNKNIEEWSLSGEENSKTLSVFCKIQCKRNELKYKQRDKKKLNEDDTNERSGN